jgi:hypothetical protein
MRRFINARFVRLLLLAVVLAGPMLACRILTQGTVTITCSFVGFGGFVLQGDYDNGGGVEELTMTVTDGAGTVLATGFTDIVLDPGSESVNVSTTYGTPPTFNPITVTIANPAGNSLPYRQVGTYNGTCPGLPWKNAANAPVFTDGRCNFEADQPVAVYPDGKGGYNFFAINGSTGYFAMSVSKETLDKNPDKGKNYLIAQAKGVRLYRLAGGGLQVNRIKTDKTDYQFNLSACGA